MDLTEAIHRDVQRRIEEYLGELFEDPYLDQDSGHFYVRYGSTAEISVEPYGPEDAMVQVMAHCVQSAP
jgi:hypothetical protein